MNISKVIKMIVPSLLVLLLFVSACGPKAPTGAEMKVELCMDLTGPYAAVCKYQALAVKDYFNYINEEEGGIKGVKVSLLEVDSKSDATIVSTHYDSAVGQGIVARIIVTTLEVLPVFSKMEADKIPSIGTSASAILFDPPGWHYSTVGDWAKQYCSAVDKYFYPEFEKKGLNRPMRLALVCWDSPLGRSGPPAVEALMAMRPGRYEVVSETFPPMRTMDYTSDLAKAKASNPDIVLGFVSGGASGMVARDAAKVALPSDVPVLVDYAAMFNPSSQELAGAAGLANAWGYSWYPVEGENYEAAKLQRTLMEKYNREFSTDYTLALFGALTFHYATEKALGEVGYEGLNGAAIKEQLDLMDNVDIGLGTRVSYTDHEGDREGPTSIRVAKWDAAKGKPEVVTDWFPQFTRVEFYK